MFDFDRFGKVFRGNSRRLGNCAASRREVPRARLRPGERTNSSCASGKQSPVECDVVRSAWLIPKASYGVPIKAFLPDVEERPGHSEETTGLTDFAAQLAPKSRQGCRRYKG